jgi:putative endonuclease
MPMTGFLSSRAKRGTFGSMQAYYVYILTNIKRNVMYIGVTNDLEKRIADHVDGRGGAFTRKYRVNTLVHVEEFQYVDEAIAREKEIKGWRRSKKDALIEASNPTWADWPTQVQRKVPRCARDDSHRVIETVRR